MPETLPRPAAQAIFPEMMSHPALFTHPNPKKIALIGDEDNSILQEVLKHNDLIEVHQVTKQAPAIKQNTPSSVIFYKDDITEWVKKLTSSQNTFDILINAKAPTPELLKNYYTLLNPEGILIQQSESPFYLDALKTLAQQIHTTGFRDLQIINFPQPDYPSGWRSLIMALKQGSFYKIREQAIFNRPFKTQYYNYDVHKAATVMPEFMREEWIS